jgi:hypothetical protein
VSARRFSAQRPRPAVALAGRLVWSQVRPKPSPPRRAGPEGSDRMPIAKPTSSAGISNDGSHPGRCLESRG